MGRIIHPSIVFDAICSRLGLCGVNIWHKYYYRRLRGHKADFRHPKDLSELILSKMGKKSFIKYAQYADKWLVREYVISKGLGDHLLDVYGSWSDANEIDFDKLPDKFALKPNNGSGGHYFCKDKSTINRSEVVNMLNDALKLKRMGYHWEPHYYAIEPKIYCEELIDTGSEAWPVDYKFTCVKGEIQDIFVCCEREKGHAKYCTVDLNWDALPYTKAEYLPETIPAKPNHLDEMIEMAKVLSADFDIVRVDLYEYNDKVYFGELTFSPWGGMMWSYTNEAVEKMGKRYYELSRK